MNKINTNIMEAVETALVAKKPGVKRIGHAVIEWDGRKTGVSYYGNQVFQYDAKTGDWWLDDCSWVTKMTKDKTEAACTAAGLPYRYFIRKRTMWLRNVETGKEWKCGSGRITRKMVEKAGI